MSAVLDTSVLVDIVRGRPAARSLYGSLSATPRCSEVSRAEVLRGMRSAERAATYRLFEAIDWHPVDNEVSALAGQLGREYRRSHGLIEIADLCIAATALVTGLPLVTSNRKHFPMFPGLARAY